MPEKYFKTPFFLYLLICGSFCFMFTGCEKTSEDKVQTKEWQIDNDYQRGPLTVHVRVDKAKPTIADTIVLELEACIEPAYEVRMPEVGKQLKNFGIVDWENLGNRLDENDNVVSTYQYELEPFLSGKYSLPAFTFQFADVNNPKDIHELKTEPIDIEVTSLLGKQRANLKIAEIEGVVEMPGKHSYWWIWFLSVSGVVAIAGTWFIRKRRKTEKLVRLYKPAHEIAYDRLRALVEQDLINTGKIKEFYDVISNILRHYIEHRFGLRAPERTTEEFLAELSLSKTLSETEQKQLSEFLRHCDLVKFAKHNPTTEQVQKTFDLVKNFVETTKSDEKKIDVTETILTKEETVSV